MKLEMKKLLWRVPFKSRRLFDVFCGEEKERKRKSFHLSQRQREKNRQINYFNRYQTAQWQSLNRVRTTTCWTQLNIECKLTNDCQQHVIQQQCYGDNDQDETSRSSPSDHPALEAFPWLKTFALVDAFAASSTALFDARAAILRRINCCRLPWWWPDGLLRWIPEGIVTRSRLQFGLLYAFFRCLHTNGVSKDVTTTSGGFWMGWKKEIKKKGNIDESNKKRRKITLTTAARSWVDRLEWFGCLRSINQIQ